MYLFGMIGSTVWVALFVATIGWCFNRMGRERTALDIAARAG